MRQPIAAAVLTLATLTGCGSEGPNTPPGATATFSISARFVPVRCDLANCPTELPVAIAVRVMELGGIMGGYVTTMDLVMRDTASGSILGSERYDAAEIASMTLLESNQVYPRSWVEIVPHPFRVAGGEGRTRTVTVAITVTDYHGNEHRETLTMPIV